MKPSEAREKWVSLSKERKLTMLTAYDYQIAKILDNAGIDMILVGDSLGMTVMGHEGTKEVTMEDMVHHIKAVARGVKQAFIVGDMPIDSDNTPEDAVMNAQRLIQAGAHSIKLEGLKKPQIRAVVEAGIPVMGHMGLLPQTAESHRVQGKTEEDAKRIMQESIELDKLGVFSAVLESMPKRLARRISEAMEAPTIGIGAGVNCDGQVLVINDLLGMDESFKPKFVKRYARLEQIIGEAVRRYIEDVIKGRYPDEEHTYH